ncbi:MAG: DUF1761 domain-containing protein [Candidatus Pacebacteria bacterium]|nr:DUF1761 domain-containing protein [Candidatus Paceibacterota bacterium]
MSILAILVAAAVCFVVGFLIHGPLFGKLWMRLAKITPTGNEKMSDMYGQMFWNYAMNVVAAFVMSGIIWMASTSSMMVEITWYRGAILAAWLWLGFVVTNSSMNVIWMGQSFKLWLFDTLSALAGLVSMGIVLALWK